MTTWIMKGGPVAWLVLACGLTALFVFLERLLNLHRAQVNPQSFLEGIQNNLKRNNVAEAVTLCEETPGPVAKLVQTAITHYDENPDQVRLAMEETGKLEIPRLEKHLLMLGTLAKIAPLLGLLGTLTALIRALMVMEAHAPLTHSGDLSGMLWQALITTALGLAIGIPAYAGHNLLVSRVESILNDMEIAATHMLTFMIYEWKREPKSS